MDCLTLAHDTHVHTVHLLSTYCCLKAFKSLLYYLVMLIVLNKKLILASLIGLIEFFQFIQCGDLIFTQSVRTLVKLIIFIIHSKQRWCAFDMNVIYLRENLAQFLFLWQRFVVMVIVIFWNPTPMIHSKISKNFGWKDLVNLRM